MTTTRCIGPTIALAVYLIVSEATSVFAQAYSSSRYPAPLSQTTTGTSFESAPSSRVQSGPRPYGDYRLNAPGHTAFDSVAACEDVGPAAYPDPSTVFDDPGLSGSDWSDSVADSSRLVFRGGVIALQRNGFSSQAFTDGATPTNASDLKTGIGIGPQGTFLYRGLFSCCWDAEVSYFQVDDFSSQAFTPVASQLLTTPAIVFAPMDVTSFYNSSVRSGEINLRHRTTDRLTFLGGFRYFGVEDDLFHKICATGMTERIRSQNRAYGFQLGVDANLLTWRRFDLNGWTKAGVFLNQAEQQTIITLVPGTVPFASASSNDASFLADLGLAASFRLTNWLSLRGGYQALWFDAAATAPPQMLSTSVVSGVATLDNSSTLFYHGGFAGLEAAW
jgi:hypothetical protein